MAAVGDSHFSPSGVKVIEGNPSLELGEVQVGRGCAQEGH